MNLIMEKKDHKDIGKEYGYYLNIGHNLPIILAKGAKVIQLLQRFVEDEEQKRGFCSIKTPLFCDKKFMSTSGHYEHYEHLIFPIEQNEDDSSLILRPVTCPFHFAVYNSEKHLYNNLPTGFFETTYLFRKCQSGELNGLYRMSQFTIADTHLICRKDQIENELLSGIEYICNFLDKLRLRNDVSFVLSAGNHAEGKYIGNAEDWKNAQEYLRNSLKNMYIDFSETTESAAFYAPKIDVVYNGLNNKKIALFTIQLDFQLPSKCNMTYQDEFGKPQIPIVIHRSSVSCYERLLGVLLEKFQGNMPFWLAPIQVQILQFNNASPIYAENVENELSALGYRFCKKIIDKSEISQQIKKAIKEKIHFIVTIGKKEVTENKISVRHCNNENVVMMSILDFIERLNDDK